MSTLVLPTDAPAVPGPPQGRWTFVDWETLPNDGNRYEVIDGVLFGRGAQRARAHLLAAADHDRVAAPCGGQGKGLIQATPEPRPPCLPAGQRPDPGDADGDTAVGQHSQGRAFTSEFGHDGGGPEPGMAAPGWASSARVGASSEGMIVASAMIMSRGREVCVVIPCAAQASTFARARGSGQRVTAVSVFAPHAPSPRRAGP